MASTDFFCVVFWTKDGRLGENKTNKQKKNTKTSSLQGPRQAVQLFGWQDQREMLSLNIRSKWL